MTNESFRNLLTDKELKITPQRVAVLDALSNLNNHPTADNIIAFIRKHHPNIASGTIYKTLETFVEKGIVKKVKTEKDVMRYDSILDNHHHLYSSDTEHIEDYYDEDLDRMIEGYFRKKKIPNFSVEDIKVQIIGKFKNKQNKK
ncbi:MAG: transcriptional repressor [Melioribacteraceae bacterium]|nr:transcriptional repressor [Melioribacteraceae bacterium]